MQGAGGKCFVLELCEQLEGLVQLDPKFHEMKGRKSVITFISDSQKDPCVLGLILVDSPPERFPVELEGDVEIPDIEPPVEGADILEGQIVIQPTPEDEVNINGTRLRESSNLASLLAGCSFYKLTTSGSKKKCFKGFLEHSKKLEVDMVMAASSQRAPAFSREASTCTSFC